MSAKVNIFPDFEKQAQERLTAVRKIKENEAKSIDLEKDFFELSTARFSGFLDNNTFNAAHLEGRGFPTVENEVLDEPTKIVEKSVLSEYTTLYDLRHVVQDILPDSRVSSCGYRPIIESEGVQLALRPDGSPAFSGLWKCGAVWLCPVCGYKISRVRQVEVYNILKYKRKVEDRSIFFLTLTVRHSIHERLSFLLELMKRVWRRLNKAKKFKSLFASMEYIRTFEILKSQKNGWHPHYHFALLFDNSNPEILPLLHDLISDWCSLTGSGVGSQNLKQANNESLADYITKFDLSSELTSGNFVKSGKGYTFLQMVHIFNETGESYLYDAIIEYQKALKGFRSISMSKGLKQFAMTDKEAINVVDIALRIFARFDFPLWKIIFNNRLVSGVLNAGKNGSIQEVIAFITSKSIAVVEFSGFIFLKN